eukprot:7259802-Pyramimonas_sp.AAC.1
MLARNVTVVSPESDTYVTQRSHLLRWKKNGAAHRSPTDWQVSSQETPAAPRRTLTPLGMGGS